MPYKLVVPAGLRRRGGAAPRSAGGTRPTTRAQRMRILEVLRLACGDPPSPPTTRARRMRMVEVLRLQAGLPVAPSEARRPRDRAEPLDISDLVDAWEEGQQKFRGRIALLGLSQDMHGRLHCAACGDFVPASSRGMCGGSMKALALWHRTLCTAVEREG